jgi:hypothetical protein
MQKGHGISGLDGGPVISPIAGWLCSGHPCAAHILENAQGAVKGVLEVFFFKKKVSLLCQFFLNLSLVNRNYA